jgi:hypothetical protein
VSTKLSIAMATLGLTAMAFPAVASADATDGYPIPHPMIITTCTAEQTWTPHKISRRSITSGTSSTSTVSRPRFGRPRWTRLIGSIR